MCKYGLLTKGNQISWISLISALFILLSLTDLFCCLVKIENIMYEMCNYMQ